jgi:serine/threonine protein phosphatase 1
MRKFAHSWLSKNTLFRSAGKPPPRIPAGIRIYAIGDVHGRIDLLDSLLKRVDDNLTASPIEQPIQVFLGDYIDRGPNSRNVLDRLIERSRTHKVICLKGNHETFLLEFLNDPAVLDNWRQWGALPTLMSYGLRPPSRLESDGHEKLALALRQAMPEAHRNFLIGLRATFVCGDYFFVHAGIRPGVPLDAQKEEDLLWIRDEFLASNTNFGKIVVHGHTPVGEPDIRKNRINIDTGAFASGNLTCLVIEGESRSFI